MAHSRQEVKGLQQTLNGFSGHWLRGIEPLDVDGEYGPLTARRLRACKYYCGWGKGELDPTDKWNHEVLEVLRHPHQTSAYPGDAKNRRNMKRRGEARRKKQKEQGGSGDGAAALARAAQLLGKTENNNHAPWLAALERKHGMAWMDGQPWCGFLCYVAWAEGAGKKLPQGVVYTPNIVGWANRGQHFTRVSPSSAKPGDLVVFNFVGGSSVADHVGLARGPARGGVIPTIEGNTSPGSGGSQANGGGCFKRTRPVGLIAVVARPK